MLSNVVFLPEEKLLLHILLWNPELPGECHVNKLSPGMCLKFLEYVGDADGVQGWKMQGGQHRAPVPHPPLCSLKSALDTLLTHPCCSSQSSAIPAPHTAGALFLGTCSYRHFPFTPWCSHSGASALAIHLRCSGPSQCPAPLPSQGSQPPDDPALSLSHHHPQARSFTSTCSPGPVTTPDPAAH